MSTALSIPGGGTGQSTPEGARKNLGLEIGVVIQPYDPGLAALAAFNTNGFIVQTANDTYSGRTITGTAAEVTVTNGDGVAGNPIISLPVTITLTGKTITGGTFGNGSFQGTADLTGTFSGTVGATIPNTGAFTTISSSGLATLNSLTLTIPLPVASGGTGANDAASARTNLGLGTIATQAANSVAITGGSISGITDLAIADGGTGASTAANARTNLGLGTAAIQNTGTSGATIPLLNTSVTFSGSVAASEFTTTGTLSVDGVQVVSNRRTGWYADTGILRRDINATYTAPTISNPPTQAEVQAIADSLSGASRTIGALKQDLMAHGLIG